VLGQGQDRAARVELETEQPRQLNRARRLRLFGRDGLVLAQSHRDDDLGRGAARKLADLDPRLHRGQLLPRRGGGGLQDLHLLPRSDAFPVSHDHVPHESRRCRIPLERCCVSGHPRRRRGARATSMPAPRSSGCVKESCSEGRAASSTDCSLLAPAPGSSW
jgi:hypothetical protein